LTTFLVIKLLEYKSRIGDLRASSVIFSALLFFNRYKTSHPNGFTQGSTPLWFFQ
jgi:hypothetical protein